MTPVSKASARPSMTQTWTEAFPLFPGSALVVGVAVDDDVAVAWETRVKVGLGDAVGLGDGAAVGVGCGDGVGVSVGDQAVIGGGIGVGVGSDVWSYPVGNGKTDVTSSTPSVSTAATCSPTVMWKPRDALSPSESVAV